MNIEDIKDAYGIAPEEGINVSFRIPKEVFDKGPYNIAQSIIRQVLFKVIVDTRLIVNLVEDEDKKTIQLTIKEKYEQSN